MQKSIISLSKVFVMTFLFVFGSIFVVNQVKAQFGSTIIVPLPGNTAAIMSIQTTPNSNSVDLGINTTTFVRGYGLPLQICSSYSLAISGCVAYVRPTGCSAGNLCTASGVYSLRTGAVVAIVTPPSVAPSVTVITPNGGEVWAAGSTHTISWSTTVNTPSVKFDIYEVPTNIPSGQDPANYIPGIGGLGRTGNSYNWVVSGLQGNTTYRIKVCISGTTICDTSNSTFTVTYRQASLPSAPTGLTITNTNSNLMKTLSWTASTPGTNPIAGYKIYNGTTLIGSSVTTSTTTTVVPGTTYSFSVKAYDTAATPNLSNTSNVARLVVPLVITNSVTVTSPHGGEAWLKNTTKMITWNSVYANSTQNKTVGISMVPYCATGTVCSDVAYQIVSSVADTGSYSWLVGSIVSSAGIPVGSYTITICQRSGQSLLACDSNDEPFNITTNSNTSPSAPTQLTAAATSATQARLAWTASTPGTNPIAGYKIYN
ncbi:MAG: hypothetical protein WCK03_01555, partial [Candidatus Taylorbacteria bacterium]